MASNSISIKEHEWYVPNENEPYLSWLHLKSLEIYIDDVVVKSANVDQHLANLEQALQKMRFHGSSKMCIWSIN